jgi:L-amino acid N-acyltransferase YncA
MKINTNDIAMRGIKQLFYGRPAYDVTVEISIYLDSKERGKGLGKEILKYCIDNSKTFGIKTILGFIFAHDKPNLKLF